MITGRIDNVLRAASMHLFGIEAVYNAGTKSSLGDDMVVLHSMTSAAQ
jgi:hypothetical protein